MDIQVKEEGGRPDQERRLLDDALDKAAGQLEALRAQLHGHKEQAKAAIFAAHSELLEIRFDRDCHLRYCEGQERCLRLEKRSSRPTLTGSPVCATNCSPSAPTTCAMSASVLEFLTGIKRKAPSYPANAVLIAEDLTPSDTATMERGKVMGLRRCVARHLARGDPGTLAGNPRARRRQARALSSPMARQ